MTTLDPAVPPTTSGDVATFSRLRHSYARGPAGQPVERVLSKDDPETGPARSHPLSAHKGGFKATVSLAFIGLGVIYGDLGTSPLYAMNGIFPASGPVPSEEDIIGGVSAVLWAVSIVPLIKYCLIALEFGSPARNGDLGGEGGPFAVYQSMYPPEEVDHDGRSMTRYTTQGEGLDVTTKSFFERGWFKAVLFSWVLFGTCLTMSDGLFTPAVSVVSAVQGIAVAAPAVGEGNKIVGISIAILAILFAIQPFGTKRIGTLFSPVIVMWNLLLLAGGIYNVTQHPGIFRAVDPSRAVMLFVRTGNFDLLQGVILAITGVEAMFANLGQFSKSSIRLGFICGVYPCIAMAYLGQGARLINDPEVVIQNVFFQSIPGPVSGGFWWFTWLFAILAAVIASQAIITAVFSLIQQLVSLKAMPPIKIVHTSDDIRGQVYVPAVNFLMFAGTIGLVGGFGTDAGLTSAYGFAVAGVLLVTTTTLAFAMVRLKHLPALVAVGYFILSAFIDCLFFGSSIKKVPHGAYVPLAMAVILGVVFEFFHWARGLEAEFDASHRQHLRDVIRTPAADAKRHDDQDDHLATASGSGSAAAQIPIELNRIGGEATPPTYTRSLELADGSASLARLPVFAFFHTTTLGGLNGAPHAFASFVRSYPSLPCVVIFFSVQVVNVPHTASEDERYLVSRVRSFEGLYLVTLRLGYRDPIDLTTLAGPVRERIVQLEAMDVEPGEVVESDALQDKVAAIDRAIGTVTHIVPHLHVQARDDGTRGVGRWVRRVLLETIYRRLKVNFDEFDQFKFGSEEEVLRVGVVGAL